MKHILSLLLLCILPAATFSQVKKTKAKIVYTGALYSTYDFTEDVGKLKPAIKLSGASSLMNDIIKYSQEGTWPTDISTFDTRDLHRPEMKEYNAYKIVATNTYCILLIPASENKHVSATMRPSHDIYFIMGLDGADYEGNHPDPKPEITSDEYDFSDYTDDYEDYSTEDEQVYITDPGEVFSTFDLANDEDAREVLVDSGILNEEEYATLCSMSVESYWPVGMSTLDKRLAAASKIKEYTAYFAATFGPETGDEYTIIWIPQEGNEHMPLSMRPKDSGGFYMVFRTSGIFRE